VAATGRIKIFHAKDDEAVTLEFLAQRQRQVIDELAAMRAQLGVVPDDLQVMTAIGYSPRQHQ
jgi:hypothetical protein